LQKIILVVEYFFIARTIKKLLQTKILFQQ